MEVPGHERFVVVSDIVGIDGSDAAQDVSEPGVGFDAVGACGLDEGVDQGAGVSAGRGGAEQPCPATDDEGADRIFSATMPRSGLCRVEVLTDLQHGC